MPTLKGDQSTVRAINRSLVLNLLRTHGSLGRHELAELTHLSAAAITGVVAELIEGGWVREARSGASTGGRPPVLLEIAYNDWHAAGVKVMEDHLEVVLTDLSTEVLAQQQMRLTRQTPQVLVKNVQTAVRELQRKARLKSDRLVGLGVGMAGVIDPQDGVCVYSPYLHWERVPVKGLLEAALTRPVWVDNDVNALAVAETLFGHGKNARNLAVVTVGRGIGAGLVLDGQIYRGATGGAGELGHTVSELNGRPCECGKRGCLEAYASEPALLEQAKAQLPELFAAREPHIQSLIVAAEAGHEGAAALLGRAGERLGAALANLVNLFNPELIVVGGEGVRLGRCFFGPAEAALRANAFNGLADHLRLHVDPWGDDAWARGAAGLAVQREVFAKPLAG